MPNLLTSPDLRNVLKLDALTCAGMGALLVLADGPLSGLAALPATLLFYAGLALFPIAVYMHWVAGRRPIPAPHVWTVVVGNLGWVAGSLLLLAVPSIRPNLFGTTFVAVQALAVAAITWLEVTALRRTASTSSVSARHA